MKNQDKETLGFWLRKFLSEQIVTTRNLSANTRSCYRDAFRLLLRYASENRHLQIESMKVSDMTEPFILGFLEDIENRRHCSVRTRNLRLATICAFARFVSRHSPEHLEWFRMIREIPLKKFGRKQITYLEVNEMEALLQAPDKNTTQGLQDYRILLFMYNTGARAEEVVSLRIKDVSISTSHNTIPLVTITGKGRKTRQCPLWKITCSELTPLIFGRAGDDRLFVNRRGEDMTRFGIFELVKRHAKEVLKRYPSARNKRISPHTIRHTTASHLLQAGIDINTIRAWLGHVSIDTTNVYAEVYMAMKAAALEKCSPHISQSEYSHWRDDKGLMAYLNGL